MIGGVLLLAGVLSAGGIDTVPRRVINAELAALVRVDTVEGPDGTRGRVVSFDRENVRAGSALAPFLARHGRIVDYLAKHTPGAEPRLLRTSDNPRVVRDSIVSALRQSEAFQHSVLSMLAAHWRRDGRVIGGFDSQRPAMYVSEMDLRRVGARFFYMDRDERTGGLVTYVCVAKNGIGELPVKMDPVIEAFAFVAVNRAFVSADGRSPLMQAYERASARVQSARGRKGETNDVRHARRMMWAEMEQSPALAAAITDAFNEHASVLPFRLRAASR